MIDTPLPTNAHAEKRLSNNQAPAILSSDSLSPVAYVTQEIVLVLGMAGAAALRFSLPITGLIVALMMIRSPATGRRRRFVFRWTAATTSWHPCS